MKQERLAEKLLQVRSAPGFSQSEMLRRLGFEEILDYERTSEYELGLKVSGFPTQNTPPEKGQIESLPLLFLQGSGRDAEK
jgi:hypothetical protein